MGQAIGSILAMQICKIGESRSVQGGPGDYYECLGFGQWAWVFGLAFLIGAGAAESPLTEQSPAPFSFDILRERARALAAREYHEEKNPELPDFLKKLNYDDYQSIHFRPDQALWQNELLQFKVHFFHRGNLFQDPVRIHVIEAGQVRDVTFATNQFDYGTNKFPKPIPADLHFAGLRVIYSRAGSADQPEV